jgi:hypothetical protein
MQELLLAHPGFVATKKRRPSPRITLSIGVMRPYEPHIRHIVYKHLTFKLDE